MNRRSCAPLLQACRCWTGVPTRLSDALLLAPGRGGGGRWYAAEDEWRREDGWEWMAMSGVGRAGGMWNVLGGCNMECAG